MGHESVVCPVAKKATGVLLGSIRRSVASSWREVFLTLYWRSPTWSDGSSSGLLIIGETHTY